MENKGKKEPQKKGSSIFRRKSDGSSAQEIDLSLLSTIDVLSDKELDRVFQRADSVKDSKVGKSHAQIAAEALFPKYSEPEEFVALNCRFILREERNNSELFIRNESLAKRGLYELIKRANPNFGENLYKKYSELKLNSDDPSSENKELFWTYAFEQIPAEVKAVFKYLYSQDAAKINRISTQASDRAEYMMFVVKGHLNAAAEGQLESEIEKMQFGFRLQDNMKMADPNYKVFLEKTVYDEIKPHKVSDTMSEKFAQLEQEHDASIQKAIQERAEIQAKHEPELKALQESLEEKKSPRDKRKLLQDAGSTRSPQLPRNLTPPGSASTSPRKGGSGSQG